MSKARILGFAVSLLLFCHSAQSDDKLRIAIIAPLSGPLAAVGAEIVAAMNIAKNDFKGRIEILVVDDLGTPRISGVRAEKLVERERIHGLIGPVYRQAAVEVMERLRGRGVPHISLASLPVSSKERPPAFFRIGTSEGRLLSLATEFLEIRLKARNIAVIGDTEHLLKQGMPWTNVFPSEAGFRILREESRLDEGAISRVLATKPEAIFLRYFPGSENQIRALLEGAKRTPVVTFGAFGPRMLRDRFPQNNLYIATVWESKSKRAQTFRRAFELQNHAAADNGIALPAYAAVEVFYQAWRKTKGNAASPEVIASAMKAGEFDTVVGKFRFQANGDAAVRGEAVYRLNANSSISAKPIYHTGTTKCSCSSEDCCREECCQQNNCPANKMCD